MFNSPVGKYLQERLEHCSLTVYTGFFSIYCKPCSIFSLQATTIIENQPTLPNGLLLFVLTLKRVQISSREGDIWVTSVQDCSLLNKASADLPSHGQYVGRVAFNPRSDWLKVILYKKRCVVSRLFRENFEHVAIQDLLENHEYVFL